MPRNAAGEFYLSPGTAAVRDETARSAHVNQRFDDLALDNNVPRPVLSGGTGSSTAAGARANLDVPKASDVAKLAGGNTLTGTQTVVGNLRVESESPLLAFMETDLPAGARSLGFRMASGELYLAAFADDGTWIANICRFDRDGGARAAISNLTRAAADARYVQPAREVTAGVGLTGGGSLAADRSIALGTPSNITATSTNSATATSHTHALPENEVRGLIAAGTAGVIGTYSTLKYTGPATVNPGDVIAGAQLRFSNAAGSDGPTVTGNWRCMGYAHTADAASRTTLWLKIS